MNELALLVVTAASIGFIHTLMGPDHYVPFIVLGRARGWSLARTTWITVGCGVGHILSSVALGVVGIATGIAVGRLEAAESARGGVAGWLLVTVGFVYAAWGLHRALKRRGHDHYHFPSSAELHDHDPLRSDQRPSDEATKQLKLTPWVLFVVFVLGPCEPLIPVLMYPAATIGWYGVAAVVAAFAGATLVAMVGAVWIGSAGIDLVPLGRLERYSHALAGAAILVSGLGVQLLGW